MKLSNIGRLVSNWYSLCSRVKYASHVVHEIDKQPSIVPLVTQLTTTYYKFYIYVYIPHQAKLSNSFNYGAHDRNLYGLTIIG